MGLNNAFVSLGRIVGPLWAGFAFDINLNFPYLTGGLIMLVGFIISFFWLNKMRSLIARHGAAGIIKIKRSYDKNYPVTLALVGAGEYLPGVNTIDHFLLSRLPHPHVVCLPTAQQAPRGRSASAIGLTWASTTSPAWG